MLIILWICDSVHTRLSRSSRSASPVQRVSTTPVNRAIRTMTDIGEILSSGALVSNDCSGADGKFNRRIKNLEDIDMILSMICR